MDYFNIRENVDLYSEMMKDYDNNFVINQIESTLLKGSTLLELGMGTGIDLISLSKNYKVVGSDYSKLFIDDFKLKSDIEVCVLDAVTLDTVKKFDCIYSNKVLQHLSVDDFSISLKEQSKHLNKNGILLFTLWHAKHKEEFEFDGQLRFVYYDETTLKSLIPNNLELEKLIYYSEFEDNDSILIVLRLK